MAQQPVVQQEVPPKAEGKSTGDKILGFFGLGKKSQEDKNEEISEIDNEIIKLKTKKKELQEEPGTDVQQTETDMYTADSKIGGRRRSRKQTGGRRRRTRRGKRSKRRSGRKSRR